MSKTSDQTRHLLFQARLSQSLVALLLGVGLAGSASGLAACADARPPLDPENTKRRPDGVVMDPPTMALFPQSEADPSEGIVALQTPLGPEVARTAVAKFFSAVTIEDRYTLQTLMVPGAKSFNPSNGAEDDAMVFWSRRFDTLEYQALGGTQLARSENIELFRGDQWKRRGSAGGSGRADVVARVRLPVVSSGRPLMGDTITFELTRSGDHFLIQRLTEDFSL